MGALTGLPALRGRDHRVLSLLGFMAAAVALRCAVFANPVVQIDEQFYALVGQRMLAGALPYINIWDRKPFGLFALFALIARLGGPGPVAYHLAAALCAGATAFVITRLARTTAPRPGATLAGLVYLAWLPVFNCIGAQTPVFYNLPVALAALATLRIAGRECNARLFVSGLGVMALLGLAIELKPTVVFEGIGMGIVLLWCARRDGLTVPRLLAYAGGWIGMALLPTALVAAGYARIGAWPVWLDANLLSIFRRHDSLSSTLIDLAQTAALLLPFAAAIGWSWRRGRPGNPLARALLGLWSAAAIAGYLAFGTYYDHYAAPLLVPLSVLTAPALGRRGGQLVASGVLLGGGLALGAALAIGNFAIRGNAAQTAHMTAAIEQHLGNGCLYLYEGDPILYSTTRSCLPTRYIFPSHINSAVESKAIDQPAALRAVLATHPTVIVMADHPLDSQPSLATRGMLERELAAHYRRVGDASIGKRRYLLFAR